MSDDWLTVAEWHKRTEWEGLCDHIDFGDNPPTAYDVLLKPVDVQRKNRCGRRGAEILVIGIRYAHRCAEHAQKWRASDEAMARLRGRIVKGLNQP